MSREKQHTCAEQVECTNTFEKYKVVNKKTLIIALLLYIGTANAQQFGQRTEVEKGPAGIGIAYVDNLNSNKSGYQIQMNIPMCEHLWLKPNVEVLNSPKSNKETNIGLQLAFDLFKICDFIPYALGSFKLHGFENVNNSYEEGLDRFQVNTTIDFGLGVEYSLNVFTLFAETKCDFIEQETLMYLGGRFNFIQNQKKNKRKKRK